MGISIINELDRKHFLSHENIANFKQLIDIINKGQPCGISDLIKRLYLVSVDNYGDSINCKIYQPLNPDWMIIDNILFSLKLLVSWKILDLDISTIFNPLNYIPGYEDEYPNVLNGRVSFYSREKTKNINRRNPIYNGKVISIWQYVNTGKKHLLYFIQTESNIYYVPYEYCRPGGIITKLIKISNVFGNDIRYNEDISIFKNIPDVLAISYALNIIDNNRKYSKKLMIEKGCISNIIDNIAEIDDKSRHIIDINTIMPFSSISKLQNIIAHKEIITIGDKIKIIKNNTEVFGRVEHIFADLRMVYSLYNKNKTNKEADTVICSCYPTYIILTVMTNTGKDGAYLIKRIYPDSNDYQVLSKKEISKMEVLTSELVKEEQNENKNNTLEIYPITDNDKDSKEKFISLLKSFRSLKNFIKEQNLYLIAKCSSSCTNKVVYNCYQIKEIKNDILRVMTSDCSVYEIPYIKFLSLIINNELISIEIIKEDIIPEK